MKQPKATEEPLRKTTQNKTSIFMDTATDFIREGKAPQLKTSMKS